MTVARTLLNKQPELRSDRSDESILIETAGIAVDTVWQCSIILRSRSVRDAFAMPPTSSPSPTNESAETLRALVAILLAVSFVGCASTRCAPGRRQVDYELQSRVSRSIGPSQCGGESLIPEDVLLDDGVTADEAVALALWNNSAFNATLAQLGMARGDLTQAGLLRNPQFFLLLPGATKQLEWALFLPVDALLLRETRLDLSEREVCRVAEELVQNGLNLVRDARVAHADLTFAVDRSALANEAVKVRKSIADLTRKQLDAGDISELEATTARIDLLRAQADAAGLAHAVAQAESRLKQLMGIGLWTTPLHPSATDINNRVLSFELQSLIAEATTCRPDLKAAAFAVEAAKKRADVSRWQWLKFDAVADANAGGAGNTNFGPGFRFDMPIFDRNQGGIQTADWSVYQATQNYNTIRDQVVMEVQTAYSQARQATDNLSILRSNVLTSLQEAVGLAGKAYADGGAPYFLVLQTASQFLDARAQELQLVSDLQKAHANLDRSVGHNLSQTIPDEVVVPLDFPNDALTPLPVNDDAQANKNEPNILIISRDGTSLFSGDTSDARVGQKLRRIADQLDEMNLESKLVDDQPTSPITFGGAITTGWRK